MGALPTGWLLLAPGSAHVCIRRGGAVGGGLFAGNANSSASEDDSGQHDEHASNHLNREWFGKDGGPENDGDDGEQVGHHRCRGAFVGDEPVVEDIGSSGAERAKDRHGDDRVQAKMRRLQATSPRDPRPATPSTTDSCMRTGQTTLRT
jgi:hypothetical protein